MLRAARPVLIATILLAACGDDVEDEPGSAVYSATATGAYTASLTGNAVFGVTLNDAANAGGFALILGGGVSPVRILLVEGETAKPRAGTYEIVAPNTPVGDDTVFAGTLTYGRGARPDSFVIQGGTITLERANHNRANGTFELRAERIAPADGAQLFISGEFDAGQIPQEFPPQP